MDRVRLPRRRPRRPRRRARRSLTRSYVEPAKTHPHAPFVELVETQHPSYVELVETHPHAPFVELVETQHPSYVELVETQHPSYVELVETHHHPYVELVETPSPITKELNTMCGATEGGLSLDGVNVAKEAIIQGQVTRGGDPVGNAYVRLLDRSGEFTAEVPTSVTGHFRFFANDGQWTLRTIAPKADPVDRVVQASVGQVAEVAVSI